MHDAFALAAGQITYVVLRTIALVTVALLVLETAYVVFVVFFLTAKATSREQRRSAV
jgi:hypothetical protein